MVLPTQPSACRTHRRFSVGAYGMLPHYDSLKRVDPQPQHGQTSAWGRRCATLRPAALGLLFGVGLVGLLLLQVWLVRAVCQVPPVAPAQSFAETYGRSSLPLHHLVSPG